MLKRLKRIICFRMNNRKALAMLFIELNSNWFEDQENGFYGMERIFQAFLEYWVKHNKFGPTYNYRPLSYCQHKFEEWIRI